MKKLFAYLALLVCILSSAPQAQAYNLDGAKLVGYGWENASWGFSSGRTLSKSGDTYTCEIKPAQTSIYMSIVIQEGNTYYCTYAEGSQNLDTFVKFDKHATTNNASEGGKVGNAETQFNNLSTTETYVVSVKTENGLPSVKVSLKNSGDDQAQTYTVWLDTNGQSNWGTPHVHIFNDTKGWNLTKVISGNDFLKPMTKDGDRWKITFSTTENLSSGTNIMFAQNNSWTNETGKPTFHNNYVYKLTSTNQVDNGTEAQDPWDFSGNTNPTSIRIYFIKGNGDNTLVVDEALSYDGSATDYKWKSAPFSPGIKKQNDDGTIIRDLYRDVYFKLISSSGKQTTVSRANNNGEFSLNTWIGNTSTSGQGNWYSGSFYHERKYIAYVRPKAGDNSSFEWKIEEVTELPMTLEISPAPGTYYSTSKEITLKASNFQGEWSYTVTGQDPVSVSKDTKTITIGNANATEDQEIAISVTGKGTDGSEFSKTNSYTLRYVRTPIIISVDVINRQGNKAFSLTKRGTNWVGNGTVNKVQNGTSITKDNTYFFRAFYSNDTYKDYAIKTKADWAADDPNFWLVNGNEKDLSEVPSDNYSVCFKDSETAYLSIAATDAALTKVKYSHTPIINEFKISASPASGTTVMSNTAEITLTAQNALRSWTYAVNGADPVTVTGASAKVNIGDSNNTGIQTVKIVVKGKGTDEQPKEFTLSYTLQYVDASSILHVYLCKKDGTEVFELSTKKGNRWIGSGSVDNKSTNYYFKAVYGDNSTKKFGIDNATTYWIKNKQNSLLKEFTTQNWPFVFDGTKGHAHVEVAEYDNNLVQFKYLEAEPANNKFPVYPLQARRAGNDWSAWTEPSVFVIGDYLNNCTLVPDWELQSRNDGTYWRPDVTLRNNTIGGKIESIFALVVVPSEERNGEYTIVDRMPLDPESYRAYLEPTAHDSWQFGHPFNLTVTLDGNNQISKFEATPVMRETSEHKIEQDVRPPFFSLVGAAYKQPVDGDTPRTGQKTDNAWQESWILYDENGRPVRDASGNYIYSTQWPPKNPVFFEFEVKVDDETTEKREIKSDQITFTLQEEVLTGAQWKEKLCVNNLYPADMKKLQDNQLYARYLLNNTWMTGASKIWSGWGGQTKDNGDAMWENNMELGLNDLSGNTDGVKTGCDNVEGKHTDGDSGHQIEFGQHYFIAPGKCNFQMNTPTYFRTMEVFFPMKNQSEMVWHKDDWVRTSDANIRPVLVVTRSYGNVTLQAKAHRNDGANEDNSGQYKLSVGDFTSGVTYVANSAKIIRYDAVASDMSSGDPANWQPVGGLQGKGPVVFEYNSETGENATPNWAAVQALANKGWIPGGADLNNGKYFYAITYKVNDNGTEVEMTVASNTFSVFRVDYHPSPRTLQIIKVNEDVPAGHGFAPYAGRYYGYAPSGILIRFGKPDADGKCPIETVLSTTLSQTLRDLVEDPANQQDFIWTSDNYIVAFNAATYGAELQEAHDKCIIGDYDKPEELKVRITDKSDNQDYDLKPETDYTGGIWGLYKVGKGSVMPHLYEVGLGYTVYDTDNTTVKSKLEVGDNPQPTQSQHILPGITNLTTDIQVEWAPTKPVYDETDPDHGPTDPEYTYDTTITVTSLIPEIRGYITNEAPKIVDPATGTEGKWSPISITVPAEEFQTRNAICQVTFDAPNVSDLIYQNYQPEYTIYMYGVTETGEELKDTFVVDKLYALSADPSEADIEAKRVNYRKPVTFPIRNIDPRLERNLRVEVVTTFKPRLLHTEIDKVYTSHPVENSTTEVALFKGNREEGWNTSAGSVTEFKTRYLKFGEISVSSGSGRTPAGLVNFHCGGFKNLEQFQEYVNDSPMNPVFYQMECYMTKDVDYSDSYDYHHVSLLMNKPKFYDYMYDTADDIATTQNPIIGQCIAPAFRDAREDLQIFIAPIYFFEYKPQIAKVSVVGGTAYQERENTPASGPRRAAARENAYLIPMQGQGVTLTSEKFGEITGIENVEAAEAVDADAEYFTVAGVRILEPRAGELYIVRRGAKVTKEIFK